MRLQSFFGFVDANLEDSDAPMQHNPKVAVLLREHDTVTSHKPLDFELPWATNNALRPTHVRWWKGTFASKPHVWSCSFNVSISSAAKRCENKPNLIKSRFLFRFHPVRSQPLPGSCRISLAKAMGFPMATGCHRSSSNSLQVVGSARRELCGILSCGDARSAESIALATLW